MKKILFTAVLCVSSLITYAQSKEAKKEIRKYYTEKQIKYINKMFSVNVKECDDLLNIVHALDEDLFKDRKHLDAYFSFFIEPFYDDICTKGDVFGYQMKLKRFIDGE